MDVDVADDVRTAVRRQQAVDQGLQAVGFLDDDLRVFAQRVQVGVRQLQFEQLRRAADAAQRVLDLVRQVADQFLVGLALVEDALLAVELQLLHVLAQLDHDLALAGRADDAVHVQRLAPGALQGQVLAQVGVLVGRAPGSHRAPSSSPLVNRLVSFWRDSDLTRDFEQVLGGRIGVAHAGRRHRPPARLDASRSRPAKRSCADGRRHRVIARRVPLSGCWRSRA